jgi:hypothetical protein
MKLDRQPSNLIDSFAQTDVHADAAMGIASNDMVDSGVGSQSKSTTSKEQNVEQGATAMDEDEDISFTEDRFRYKNVSEGDESDEEGGEKKTGEEDDKKDDEVSVVRNI